MTFGLTPRQNDLLLYLKQRAGDPVAPTFGEMAIGIGCVSKGNIKRLIDGLEQRGFVKRLPGRHRSVTLTEQSQ